MSELNGDIELDKNISAFTSCVAHGCAILVCLLIVAMGVVLYALVYWRG